MPRTARRPRNPLTLTEASARTGRHHVTIRRWISQGLLTGYRVGPKILVVDADELDQLTRPVPAAGR